MVPNSGAPTAMLQNTAICYVFAPSAPQKLPERSILAIFGSTMSATPQCGVKIGPNLAPSKQHLKPDDARKGYHEPTMPTRHLSKSQGLQNYEGKGQEGSMCAVSLIAIELKGLAAPGEALKNISFKMLEDQPRDQVGC